MKILVFMTQFYCVGGAERLQIELAEELNKRGIQTDILSLYAEKSFKEQSSYKDLLLRNIRNIHSFSLSLHPHFFKVIFAILKLRWLIFKNNYAVVETSSTSTTIIAAWATKYTKARHVVGIHQLFDHKVAALKINKFLKFSIKCNKTIRYYAVSTSARDSWMKYYNTAANHIRKIYNSIHPSYNDVLKKTDLYQKEFGFASDVRIIIYVGRITNEKGLDTLFTACMPIIKSNNIALLYVGKEDLFLEQSKKMLSYINEKCQIENISERVKFLGFRYDTPQLMAAADLLVHPSRTEAFGLVLVEAMATGLQIVASNVDGIPEVLAGTDSIMVEPDDPQRLQDAILQVLNRNKEQKALAIKKGVARAKQFSTTKRVDAMLEMLQEVVYARQ